MRSIFRAFISYALSAALGLGLVPAAPTDNMTADCSNGNFIGVREEETGVLSFKGIPYAKAPVGDLRWKAPEAPDESDETFTAYEYGASGIQYYWFSEPIETETSEDCLTLNVWTSGLDEGGKAVMVYFHGGAFAWGGSSEDIYDGQYIVDAHNDVIVVTVNYRLGMMGFIDFTGVEGGEDFPDSRELGLLDCVQALKWVKENISSFGGDPDNVTIFGESAGGAIVSCLLASDYAGELFGRVIAQSGSLRLTYDADSFAASYMTDALMALSGAESMADLMALSESELAELNEYPLDEDGTCINDLYNLPLAGGSVVNCVGEDMYAAVRAASARGVDLLIGSNADEENYWVVEMGASETEPLSAEASAENLYIFENYYIPSLYETTADKCSAEELADLAEYISLIGDSSDAWTLSKLFSESVYTLPAIKTAEYHSEGALGSTYLYYFAKRVDSADYLGACHSAELAYVFRNLSAGSIYGTIDERLADELCGAWVNFAKTGNPSTETTEWFEYDVTDRLTMVIGDDCTISPISDPNSAARTKIGWISDKPVTAEGA